MIPPDTAFEEGSAKSNIAFTFGGIGVLGLASVCVAVVFIFLCANKERRKKTSNESREGLLANQVHHGIDNIVYGPSRDGIGECILNQTDTSVSQGSTRERREGKSQNSALQSSESLSSTQNDRLTNEERAIYDIPTSNKPLHIMPIQSEQNQILFGRIPSEVNPYPLPCEEILDSEGYSPKGSADELYRVPKSNKPIDDKKPLPSHKQIQTESDSRMDKNKIQYEFIERRNLEFESKSLYAAHKSYKSTDETRPPCSVTLGERLMESKNSNKDDNECVPTIAMTTSSSMKCPRSPLLGSETGDDKRERQFTKETNSKDVAEGTYNLPKSKRPRDDRKPLSVPKIEHSSEALPIDGVIMDQEAESKEPHTRCNKTICAPAASKKREILEQKHRFQPSLSNKRNEQSMSAGLSRTRIVTDESKLLTGLYSDSDTKTRAYKEADPKNNLPKSVPGKQVQNTEAYSERKPKLVSTRGDTIDNDESYTALLMNASDIKPSNIGTDDDPSMIKIMFPCQEVDLPPPPTPCHFTYGHEPMAKFKQKMSEATYVNSMTESHAEYINCDVFSRRNDSTNKLKVTNVCPPAPCFAQGYVNIPHSYTKELEEDIEYVPMNKHDNLHPQATDNSVTKYANIEDVRLTTKIDCTYLPMNKHLLHANSDTYLYQNGGSRTCKENKNMYVNSLSFESNLKGFHDSEQDDPYCYASVDFFWKNKMAADVANKSVDCTNEVQKPAVKSTSFLTAISAKEKDIMTKSMKSQNLHQSVFVSNTIPAGKRSLETIPPRTKTMYK